MQPFQTDLRVEIDSERIYLTIGPIESSMTPTQARKLCGFLLEAADTVDPADLTAA